MRSYPSHLEGMATLAAELPADEAAEGFDLIDQLARMAKADGDARPIGQIRAGVFSLLIRRPRRPRPARDHRQPDDHRRAGRPRRQDH